MARGGRQSPGSFGQGRVRMGSITKKGRWNRPFSTIKLFICPSLHRDWLLQLDGQLIDFGRQNEIVLRETADSVRPNLDTDISVADHV